ncbi:hypothetical protein JHK86_016189 [Glycine max]|nr:hypothetical protein JHK86_016189 [Glycine max]
MDRDFKGINPVNQDELVVIFIIIANFMVSRVPIDQDSSTDILVHRHASPLLGFAGKKVETRGYMDFMTTFGQGKLSRSFTIRYLLVDADTSHFVLIGIKTLNELGAIVSTPHLKMKFPALKVKIVTIMADQKQARQ